MGPDSEKVRASAELPAIEALRPEVNQGLASNRILQVSLFQKLLWNIAVNTPTIERDAKVPPRISQWKAINKLTEFLRQEGWGGRSGHFVLPPGSGKTFLFAVIAKLLGVRTLVLGPRTNLVDQAYETFTKQVGIAPELIGMLSGNAEQLNRPITIGTYQGHLSRMEHDSLYRANVQRYELIICDEAHKALGPATQASIDAMSLGLDPEMTKEEEAAEQEVLNSLAQYTHHRALRLAFTATSQLMHKAVHEHFGPLICHESHSDQVKAGVLAIYRIIQVQGHVQPGEIGSTISVGQESGLLEREEIYDKAIEKFLHLEQEVPERLLPIAFLSNIHECDKFKSKARKRGLKSAVVTSREVNESGGRNRIREAQEELLEGKIKMLISVEKLQLGWDFPPLNTVLQLRATTSPAILIQQAGRASRRTKDKEAAYIIEPRWRPDVGVEGTSTGGGGGGSGEGGKGSKGITVPIKPQKFFATPLTLAEALHVTGDEDVDAACERADGKKLSYDIVKSLLDNGTVELGGDTCIYLKVFADAHNHPLELFEREIQQANLQPVGFALFQREYVPVYRLSQVFAIPGIQEHQLRQKLHSRYGVLIEGVNYITKETFCMFHGLPIDGLTDAIAQANVGPHIQCIANESFMLYLLSELEALPFVQLKSTLQEVPLNLAEVDVRGVRGIIPRSYAIQHNLHPDLLERICRDNLLTIGYALSIGEPQPIFAKVEVESIPIVRDWLLLNPLPEIDEHTAHVTLKGGGVGLSLAQFCLLHPSIDFVKLLGEVKSAGMEPIGMGRFSFLRTMGATLQSVQKDIDTNDSRSKGELIYSREQILNLPYVQDCLDQEASISIPHAQQ
ncbi:MAG: type III restriction protein res subunit [Candidatus Peregrinibacteria bacterium Greene0416_19]|nr:MAG: type III restriction protein res subunit [Candidatus Peregrinibacteria bacterium Greene0416_19]